MCLRENSPQKTPLRVSELSLRNEDVMFVHHSLCVNSFFVATGLLNLLSF